MLILFLKFLSTGAPVPSVYKKAPPLRAAFLFFYSGHRGAVKVRLKAYGSLAVVDDEGVGDAVLLNDCGGAVTALANVEHDHLLIMPKSIIVYSKKGLNILQILMRQVFAR